MWEEVVLCRDFSCAWPIFFPHLSCQFSVLRIWGLGETLLPVSYPVFHPTTWKKGAQFSVGQEPMGRGHSSCLLRLQGYSSSWVPSRMKPAYIPGTSLLLLWARVILTLTMLSSCTSICKFHVLCDHSLKKSNNTFWNILSWSKSSLWLGCRHVGLHCPLRFAPLRILEVTAL